MYNVIKKNNNPVWGEYSYLANANEETGFLINHIYCGVVNKKKSVTAEFCVGS